MYYISDEKMVFAILARPLLYWSHPPRKAVAGALQMRINIELPSAGRLNPIQQLPAHAPSSSDRHDPSLLRSAAGAVIALWHEVIIALGYRNPL